MSADDEDENLMELVLYNEISVQKLSDSAC